MRNKKFLTNHRRPFNQKMWDKWWGDRDATDDDRRRAIEIAQFRRDIASKQDFITRKPNE